MKRNSKGMLSIIVIAILALTLALPGAFATLTDVYIDDLLVSQDVTVGQTLTVSGDANEVTSGATVNVYWDIAEGSGAWLLNSTTGKSDGSYTVEVDVPNDVNGSHYIWVKDPYSTASSAALNITRSITVDPDEGLYTDEVTVEGTGFGGELDITIVFENSTGNVYSEVMVTSPTDVETDEFGSFTCKFDIPNVDYGDYTVVASDDIDYLNTSAPIKVGASISLDIDEGPAGTIITVSGRGFINAHQINDTDVTWDGCPIDVLPSMFMDDTPWDVDDGDFSGELVAPSYPEGTYDITVSATQTGTDSFKIDGETVVEVDPSYGAPGAMITVKGYNFTQDANVDVEVALNYTGGAPGWTIYVTAETNADGTFEDVFQAPAIPFDNYKARAIDEYGLNDTTGFKVGLIAMIINPTSGPSGTDVALTGIGFANGAFNMSFGTDEDYVQGDVVNEAIAENFFVPTVAPGVYDVAVTDSNENVLTTTFTVTDTTSLTPTPENVAIGYNVSFYGEYYSEEAATTLTWYIYNSTWELAIDPIFEGADVEVGDDGNFTGYWVATEDLLLGNSYYINCTDANDLYAETMITIVEEEIEIWPNSLSYSLGEVITFTIKATFEKVNSELEIWDPDGELIFLSIFELTDWVLADDWQVVRYWNQVNQIGNPLLIPNDAQIGTWNWTLTDVAEDEVVASGQIEVLPTTAEQVDQRLSAVEGSLADLAEDISGVTTELEDDIGDLAGDIADVASEVDDLRDGIVSDLADDIAGAIDAADAAAEAVADLESSVSDIADVASDAKSAADSAAAAADDAATAAEDAKTAATGLTTLVYGAIGASLIAALAAIVSLMQISRKIA
jgi:uncharacterized protein YoxC